ncbi:MAG: hypothetical protein GY835_22360, partial [bacterium]|nr:hypothetical protein [bacterium]
MTRKELIEIIEKTASEGKVKLDLSNKGIRELPSEIGKLTNLESLFLYSNKLTSIPETIEQLTDLQTLHLTSNQLTSLPKIIGRLTNLQTLHLNNNRLAALPGTVGQLTNLETLSLNNNQLMSLPAAIEQLTSLKRLALNHNELASLPGAIGQLANLQILHLNSNQLTSLPETVGRLTNLQTLSLGSNRLTSLPEAIGQLTNLKKLYLSGNLLVSLPGTIGQLANLAVLQLHSNLLTLLPETIGHLANLQTLYLSNNRLTSLPKSLAQLERLDRLELIGNPLNPALESAYKSGLDTLRSYLMSIEEPARREELYEAKLVLVGEGGVGKTTMLKAMTGQEPREDEPTTHGVKIEIQPLTLPHPERDGVEIRLNAWDFGGQEVYRVTHQFFFSRRSIYLLVWEPRRGVQQCQVEDWLKLIRLRVGDDARVIIVSTHCRTGERIARIDKPVLERDFGSLIGGFHEVDSLVDDPETGDKVGIAALRDLIAAAAKDLEQMGMEFNRDWRKARDELLALGTPRITYREFAAVCERHGLDAMATRTLAVLMHDLGYVVHYGDDERLADDVVLRPDWLTKAIGFVLEDRTTQEMDGILPDARLQEVWENHPFAGEP